ncbi:hypothetical protein DSECCO2_251030 [anaerobic digester metagenome]
MKHIFQRGMPLSGIKNTRQHNQHTSRRCCLSPAKNIRLSASPWPTKNWKRPCNFQLDIRKPLLKEMFFSIQDRSGKPGINMPTHSNCSPAKPILPARLNGSRKCRPSRWQMSKNSTKPLKMATVSLMPEITVRHKPSTMKPY